MVQRAICWYWENPGDMGLPLGCLSCAGWNTAYQWLSGKSWSEFFPFISLIAFSRDFVRSLNAYWSHSGRNLWPAVTVSEVQLIEGILFDWACIIWHAVNLESDLIYSSASLVTILNSLHVRHWFIKYCGSPVWFDPVV